MQLFLAPLQGFTDAVFRNVFMKHFGYIDDYYAPYITLQNNGEIRPSQWRDIVPENNLRLPVPQILPANAKEALELTRRIVGLGVYNEININMGCPYPMVTGKGKGCALLQKPEEVSDILDVLMRFYGRTINFSVKMRCGLNDFNEILNVVEVLNEYPIRHVILHPRIGKQLYKGDPDLSYLQTVYDKIKHPLYYNGDIFSLDDYNTLIVRYPWLQGVMLGRGVLRNPLLPEEIKTGEVLGIEQRLGLFNDFHQALINENQKILSGDGHLLNKMMSYLPYFYMFNDERKKAYKKVKKSKGMLAYREGMSEFLS